MDCCPASSRLGGRGGAFCFEVVLSHCAPGIIDAARVNLAAAWLMLVVSELLARQGCLAFHVVRAQRFYAVDRIFALLLVFGFVGLASDLRLADVFPGDGRRCLVEAYIEAIERGRVLEDRSSPRFLSFELSRIPGQRQFPIASL